MILITASNPLHYFHYFTYNILKCNFFVRAFFNIFLIQDNQSVDNDIMDQIYSSNAKLGLLKKTYEIEQEESIRAAASIAKRNADAQKIRDKNREISVATHTEQMFRREEEERREIVSKMKQYAEQLGLSSITDILQSFEGTFCFTLTKLSLFNKKKLSLFLFVIYLSQFHYILHNEQTEVDFL